MSLKQFKTKLDAKINEADQVFLVPHKGIDFDAMASCIAMALIVKKFKKPVYIIIDEDPLKIEPGVKMIIDEINKEFNIINLEKYKQLKGNRDLLITLDVNKDYLICCKDCLINFNDIIVIDHHKEDSFTIQSDCKYIDISLSSVSELMTELLCLYSIRYDVRIADYLLAGIYLDSNKFGKNVSSKTMKIVSKLMIRGAELKRVNELFAEDFVSDRKVQNLVDRAIFINYIVAVCIAEEDMVYTKEELAKVADYLLKYKVDAGFSVGYVDDKVLSISARSKGDFDVGDVMSELGGGGNEYSAATKLENCDIKEKSNCLVRKLVPSYCHKKLDKVLKEES